MVKTTKTFELAAQGPTNVSPDLAPMGTDPWKRIVVPAEWEPVARICIRIQGRLEAFTDRVVECIWREIPFYATTAVPRDDVTLSVFRNLDMLILGLAECRGPREDELMVRRELGRRRAAQGLAADALLQAYHVGFRELWKEMVAEAAQEPFEASALLLTAASTVWEWVHQVTNTVADSYHETMLATAAQAAGMRQRMLEIIRAGDHRAPELASLASSLGFSADDSFRAYAVRTDRGEHPDPAKVQEAVDHTPGRHLTGIHATTSIVLSQGDDPTRVATALRAAFPQGTVGIGLSRAAFDGARLTIEDAGDALARAIAAGLPLCNFEDGWVLATLLRSSDRLDAILTRGAAVAAENPHLAEAITAFASERFSVSGAARTLTVHSNTVAYRLRRWHDLTGWDPHTFEGLAASLACLPLSPEQAR